jgi:hypothetical protein
LLHLLRTACFTKLNLDKKLTDEQFFEWLIGFIDAEGNFDIRKFSNRPYAFEFRFRIGLHSYDTEVLVKIQNKLGIGSITPWGSCGCKATAKEKKSQGKKQPWGCPWGLRLPGGKVTIVRI